MAEMTVGGIVLDETVRVDLSELCQCCDVTAEFVIDLVDEGILQPEGSEPARWRFRGIHITRVQRAVRLTNDLRVNLPGVALALELLEELELLRRIAPRDR